MFTTKNLIVLIGKQALITAMAVVSSLILVLILTHQISNVSNAVVKERQLSDRLSKRTELLSAVSRDIAMVGTNDALFERPFISADNILEYILALENLAFRDRKSTRLNSSHYGLSRMPSSA